MGGKDESGLQPSILLFHLTQGFALGWYESGLWPFVLRCSVIYGTGALTFS
jgi:hypothetical protein